MCTEGWIAFGSIGTFLIVVVNLVIIFVIPWWKAPKFAIDYQHHERPYCRVAWVSDLWDKTSYPQFTTPEKGIPAYWIRLRVTNSGRSTARRCLGKLVDVMNEVGEPDERFDPMQLIWVSTSWLEVPFRTVDLGRKDYQYLNILATQDTNAKVYLTGEQFVWARYEPRGIPNSLEPGKYILRITVYGDDVEPKTAYVSLLRKGFEVEGGPDLKDIDVAKHDNLAQAKSWFSKYQHYKPRPLPLPKTTG